MSGRASIATPDVKRRMIALAKHHWTPAQIAAEIGGGLSPTYVSNILGSLRRAGEDIPYGRRGPTPSTLPPFDAAAFASLEAQQPCEPPKPSDRTSDRSSLQRSRHFQIELDQATFTYLATAASRRGVRVPYMVAELLGVIAKDGMIDAVLDDGIS